MKILLVKPYWPYPYNKGENTYNRIWPPLCLANCASILLKEGYEVKILDAHAKRIKPRNIKNFIKGFDKIFITSSALDRWICPNIDISFFLESIKNINKITNEYYILGYHGTVDSENMLRQTNAKAVIRGEPENTILEICKNENLEFIKGITYFSKEKIISNEESSPLNLSKLPIPAYQLLDHKKYQYEILGKNFTLFEISRGCNYGCKFCSKIMYGKTVRSKLSQQIINEVRIAIEKFDIKTGYFIDLEFLSNKQIVEDLCNFLITQKYYFKWCCQTRPDSITEGILKKMKKAGCQLIHIGIESGLQKNLDIARKGITLNKIQNAVSLCKKEGIMVLAFFLFGFKGEESQDRQETLEFAKRLNTNFVSFHKIHLYNQDSIDLFENSNEIDKFIRKAFLKYYLRYDFLKQLDLRTAFYCNKLFFNRLKTLVALNQ